MNSKVDFLATVSEVEKQKEIWNFSATQRVYETSIKTNNKCLFEYIIFLADTGQLDLIYTLVNNYGFEFFRSLVLDKNYQSNKKDNVIHTLNFMQNEYFASINMLEKNSIEACLIYLSNQKNLAPLQNYLMNHLEVFKRDNGKTQMIINFAINKLMQSHLFNTEMALNIISIYCENKSVNKQRKKYVLSNIIDYFYTDGNTNFFKYLEIKGGYLQKLLSAIHLYGDDELGSKIYKRKLQEYVKYNSISFKAPKTNPRIAVCISGMLRGDTKGVLELIQSNIINPLNADVFIHTWDVKHLWMGLGGDVNWVYRLFGGKVLKTCPEELKLQDFIKINFPNIFKKLSAPEELPLSPRELKQMVSYTRCMIENESVFLKSLPFSENKLKSRGSLNQAKMFYGLYKSVEIMRAHEEKNNFNYDYIVRCRPDIGLNNKLLMDDFVSLERDEVMVDFFPYGPQDQFMAGGRATMISLTNIWEEMIRKESLSPFGEYPNIDSHNLLLLWMIENHIISKPTNITRDVSMGARGAKMPSIIEELKLDWEGLSDQYKLRKDFRNFFASLGG